MLSIYVKRHHIKQNAFLTLQQCSFLIITQHFIKLFCMSFFYAFLTVLVARTFSAEFALILLQKLHYKLIFFINLLPFVN